jgi:hypothetical protein
MPSGYPTGVQRFFEKIMRDVKSSSVMPSQCNLITL